MWYDMLIKHCSSQLVKQRGLDAAKLHTILQFVLQNRLKNSEILYDSLQNVHDKRLGVLSKCKASYYSVEDDQLAVLL
jgi:hypothetical protein